MKQAQRDVETAVNTITNLPEDSETPRVTQAQFFDRVARLAVTGNVSESVLRVYAKKIRDDLIERGIDKISFTGLRNREMRVEIPEREMRRLDLTISEVSKKISGNSRDIPSGQMDGAVEKQLRALADIRSQSALGRVEIKAFNSGEKVLLRDIAKIENGFAKGQPQGFSVGKRAIQLTVQRAETADTLATNKILSDYLDEITDQLPANIKITKYDVRANALTERIMLLVRNGLGGLVLVVAILFIFLSARVALWVALGIPTAMLATIGFMYISGQTINMVSLFGLIMMLGIIVDDAIVVGEHTATRFSAGDNSYVAAENGAGRMMKPVLAAMITTIAAFFPILLIRGTIGQIIGVLPLVVIAVIIASQIECFLVLPGHLEHSHDYKTKRIWSYWLQFFFSLIFGAALLGISLRTGGEGLPGPIASIIADIIEFRNANKPLVFAAGLATASLLFGTVIELGVFLLGKLKNHFFSGGHINAIDSPTQSREAGGFRRSFDRSFDWFRDRPFNGLVSLAFNWRYVTVAVSAASIMIGAYGLQKGGHVGFVFFPTAEAENLSARVVFHAGTPEKQTIAGVARIEAALKEMENKLTGGKEKLVVATFVTLGASGRSTGDHLAQIRVQLTTSEFRSVRTPDIVRGWRRAIPKIAGVKRVSVFEHRGGPPGRDVDIELQGDNAGTLKAAASEIIPLVEAIDGASGVADDLPYGKPELIMELTPRGSALGFSIEDIGRQLRDSFEGAIPRRFADGDDEVTVRVTQIMRQRGLAALRNFELRSPSRAFVSLSEIVTIREQQGFSAIERVNGKATISITADLDSKITTTEKAIQILESSGLSGITTKYGVSYKFGGRAEERKKAFEDLLLGAIIALLVIYIILAWVFSSYWRPFAVMLIIPFGVVG
ncbi:MAG: efflux RND transporter permease subunit, partial [Mariprofundaceae bacterium]|nr:efflux RND transporter permease subunit [Mariprofundaceae bacterium]